VTAGISASRKSLIDPDTWSPHEVRAFDKYCILLFALWTHCEILTTEVYADFDWHDSGFFCPSSRQDPATLLVKKPEIAATQKSKDLRCHAFATNFIIDTAPGVI